VQPYIALGRGLQAAGHVIRCVTHQDFADLVGSHDLEFWPIEGSVQAVAQGQDMRALLEGGNFLKIMRQMALEAQVGAIRLAQAGLAACQGVDLLLAGMGGVYIGLSLAEKLGLPLLQAYLVPFTPTGAFPSVLVPDLPPWLGRGVNRLSHHLTRQLMWQGFRRADNHARKQVLGLAPAPLRGLYHAPPTCGLPVIYGYSPSVIPKPPDWGPEVHLTGYWFLDEDRKWTPPDALLDFIESGPPPVYIGFGSLSSKDPAVTTKLVIRALSKLNQRAILLSGWGGMHQDDLPRSIYMLQSVPHAWLFPMMAAVVHHGGVGTTAAGLRAGVPSVVIPFFGDQPFWGKRIAELGVGPVPIPRKKLDAEQLASAIQTAVTDPEIRQRAANLGLKIRSEDGIARAVDILQKIDLSIL